MNKFGAFFLQHPECESWQQAKLNSVRGNFYWRETGEPPQQLTAGEFAKNLLQYNTGWEPNLGPRGNQLNFLHQAVGSSRNMCHKKVLGPYDPYAYTWHLSVLFVEMLWCKCLFSLLPFIANSKFSASTFWLHCLHPCNESTKVNGYQKCSG